MQNGNVEKMEYEPYIKMSVLRNCHFGHIWLDKNHEKHYNNQN